MKRGRAITFIVSASLLVVAPLSACSLVNGWSDLEGTAPSSRDAGERVDATRKDVSLEATTSTCVEPETGLTPQCGSPCLDAKGQATAAVERFTVPGDVPTSMWGCPGTFSFEERDKGCDATHQACRLGSWTALFGATPHANYWLTTDVVVSVEDNACTITDHAVIDAEAHHGVCANTTACSFDECALVVGCVDNPSCSSHVGLIQSAQAGVLCCPK